MLNNRFIIFYFLIVICLACHSENGNGNTGANNELENNDINNESDDEKSNNQEESTIKVFIPSNNDRFDEWGG